MKGVTVIGHPLVQHGLARLRDGRWASSDGQFYPEFDPAIHVIDRFLIPAEWPRFVAIDFGYTNPFVAQWWAMDEDRRMYRYREIYHAGRIVEDHTRDIIRLSGSERITAYVADHDAEDRATMARHGIRTIAAEKGHSIGFQAVRERLRIQGDGRPRLFFLRDSLVERDTNLSERALPTCTEAEFDGYAIAPNADGRAGKEEPQGVNDHGLDACRYGCTWADCAVRPGRPALGPSTVIMRRPTLGRLRA